MLALPALLLTLAAAEPPAPPRDTRAELEVCAARIEELKARHELGVELHRLLRRAQELAAELEQPAAEQDQDLDQSRSSARAEADAPGAEELRERADAARDEADRLAAEIAALDVRIEDAGHTHGESTVGVERAALGTPTVRVPSDRLRALQAQRALLSERRRRAEAEAARLDAAARDADRERD
jgi:hypothetical protein